MTELFMDLVGQPFEGSTNYNTAPRQKAWIIREGQDEQLQPASAQWWLIPSWAKEESYKYSMFNARSENVTKSPAFRGPFRSSRCVVPVTGFYEWVNRNGKKQPYFVHSPENNGLLLAGLWDRWVNPETNVPLESFTILTTNVVEDLKFLHHRQPVMLDRDQARSWLGSGTDVSELREMFEPSLPYDMQASPVSTYVNNVRNQGEACIEQIGESINLRPGSF